MVNKRGVNGPAPEAAVPALKEAMAVTDLVVPAGTDLAAYDTMLAGSADLWDAYMTGEKINHADGRPVEEAEHMRSLLNTPEPHEPS